MSAGLPMRDVASGNLWLADVGADALCAGGDASMKHFLALAIVLPVAAFFALVQIVFRLAGWM